MSYFEQAISEHVWQTKYRYQSENKIIEHTIEDTWERVAHAVSENEFSSEKKFWEKKYYQLLENFYFLPGGRILAGAGTPRKVTLFNCFVMKIKQDALADIFDALKEGAVTLQQGGGVGYDFSILRPAGDKCSHTDAIASGPVSFMRIWDSMSATMMSGARRGAMMANLRIDHPDIQEFIKIKSHPNELRHFNLSVIITKEFMKAVAENKSWSFVFPDKNHKEIYRRWSGNSKKVSCKRLQEVDAATLWRSIIESAYSYAEPGVIFEDTINYWNPLWYCEWISATNPCGEIPLPNYGACNLGSINLTQFVKEPFSENAAIDWTHLENAIEMATRFLDNVIDISHYPLTSQKQAAINTRRIGLGFTGLADAFVMLRIQYGSPPSLNLAKEIAKRVSQITWLTSSELAKAKGSFPLFRDEYLAGPFVLSLPDDLQKKIRKQGMRNSHHNAIAPTGSISLLANNVSGGIEPIFAKEFKRNVRTVSGDNLEFTLQDYAYHLWKKNHQEEPSGWKEVASLTPKDHLAIQAVVQPFIDNAISKTINIPADYPLDDVIEIYSNAYKMGLKGCTIFRPNPITGSILSSEEIDRCCA